MTTLVKLLTCLCLAMNLALAAGVPLHVRCGQCVTIKVADCCACCKAKDGDHRGHTARGLCQCCLAAPVLPASLPGQDEKPALDAGGRGFVVAAVLGDAQPVGVAAQRPLAIRWDVGPPRRWMPARVLPLLM